VGQSCEIYEEPQPQIEMGGGTKSSKKNSTRQLLSTFFSAAFADHVNLDEKVNNLRA
jgi:hypothetical protein